MALAKSFWCSIRLKRIPSLLFLLGFALNAHANNPKFTFQECLMGNDPSSSWFGRYAMVRWVVKIKRDPSRWYYILHFLDRDDYLAVDLFEVDYVERTAIEVHRKFCSF